jgi:hypothetical protein
LLLVETSATSAYALARHLYEAGGYRREAVVANFYAPGDDLLIYVKDIGTGADDEELAGIYRGASRDTHVEAPFCYS